jgi:hypothetical protein
MIIKNSKSNGNLDKLQKNIKNLAKTTSVTLPELMNETFIASCSKFSSVNDLFEASGFKLETKEDFAAVPEDEWDDFIQSNTSYENWQEMQKAAHSHYLRASINKGLK